MSALGVLQEPGEIVTTLYEKKDMIYDSLAVSCAGYVTYLAAFTDVGMFPPEYRQSFEVILIFISGLSSIAIMIARIKSMFHKATALKLQNDQTEAKMEREHDEHTWMKAHREILIKDAAKSGSLEAAGKLLIEDANKDYPSLMKAEIKPKKPKEKKNPIKAHLRGFLNLMKGDKA